MKTLLRGLAAAFVLSGAAQAAPLDYRIDPEHTEVVVGWDHLGFSKPTAHASGIEGVIRYDAAKPEASSVALSVPLARLTSHVAKLDEMLQGPQFFDTARYPDVRFESQSVENLGDDRLRIHGTVRIKEQSRPLTLEARLNRQGVHPMAQRPAIGFDAQAVLKRSDFGVDAFAPDVSDAVLLRITVEAISEAGR
ncbi:YceI family protein [Bordetella trematum]|uniref:YceI family protein n=1 Tax=Bordetella trematum TaxID=123899 RepID=UPI00052EED01|nr:YceI family protein [Bordetella trematum]